MSAPRGASRTARERAARAAAGWNAPLGPTIDDQIDDGELIATAAVRLAVKNDLILRAFRNGEDYDEAPLADAVRRELLALADEKAENVERVKAIRRSIRWPWGMARRHHLYRQADLEILRRRQEIDDGLAARPGRLSQDDSYVAGVVAAARDAALDELARWVCDKAASLDSTAMIDEDYKREREERTRLVLADLGELERTRDADMASPAH